MAPGNTPVLLHDILVSIAELVDYSDLPNLRLACKPLLEAVRCAAVEVKLCEDITAEQILGLGKLFPNATSLDASVEYHGYMHLSERRRQFLALCKYLPLTRLDLEACAWIEERHVQRLLNSIQPNKLLNLNLRATRFQNPASLQVIYR